LNNSENMYIIAHRGFHRIDKENRLKAFNDAIGIADYIEMDLRKTLDNKIVINHNPEIKGKLISKHTYKELLKVSKDLCTFEQVLKNLSGKIKFDIELKETGYESEILKLINKYLLPKDYIIISFKPKAIKKIKELSPKTKTGLLIYSEIEILELRKLLKDTKADFIMPKHYYFDFKLYHPKKFPNHKIILCTVDGKFLEKHIRKYKDNKFIYAITTDDPDLANNLLK